MANYHVTFDRDQKNWRVVKTGSERASALSQTQKEAESIAKEFCAGTGGGEVRIHRRDNGKIRDSDTVVPGNDPRNVKDTKF